MSEMIEKVARAICRAGICGPRSHLDEQENLHWRSFEIQAKASIEALREPTTEMVTAAMAPYVYGNDEKMNETFRTTILGYWQAMIDAAQNE